MSANHQAQRRREMVVAVRRGQSMRAVARQFAVGVATVAYWVQRAEGQSVDRVNWEDRSRVPHTTRRVAASLEDLVLLTRRQLHTSGRGAVGGAAIRQALIEQGHQAVPSVRTIHRILARRGALKRSSVARPLCAGQKASQARGADGRNGKTCFLGGFDR